MSRTLHLVNWMALLFAVFYMIFYMKAYENELVSFDEWCLQKQVNYASDSAIEALLDSGHTEQDYLDGDYARVEPDMAVNEFTEILAMDFDYTPTVKTNEIVQQQYIRTLLVCTYDGVYAYWNQKADTLGTYKFVGTPKIPYFYTDPNTKEQYVLTLGLEKGYKDNVNGAAPGGTIDKYEIEKYGKINLSKDVQLTAINNTVAEILNYSLVEAYSGRHRTTYEIPALASEVTGGQIVDRITVLGIVEGRATSSTSVITAEAIGGAQIIENDPVVGYTLNGSKLFARASRWKKIATDPGFKTTYGLATDFDITKVKGVYYDTPFEAAREGYYDCLYGLKYK